VFYSKPFFFALNEMFRRETGTSNGNIQPDFIFVLCAATSFSEIQSN
jgi:hypothetical protein